MSRIAIIGAGPRAAQALERLATIANQEGRLLPWVDVIAPGDDIGAGENYSADQPDWLRLNVSSSAVDAWPTAADNASRRGPSFDVWREQESPGSTADQFPSRALAGQYLTEAGAQVRSEVPGRRINGCVQVVRPGAGRGWSLQLTDGRWLNGYDEVLLATGHARDWDGALAHRMTAAAENGGLPLVCAVFPIDTLRERAEELNDGDLVVVRGAALTALDAALTLDRDRDRALHIVLTSRTGRLMVPKSDPAVLRGVLGSSDLESDSRSRVLKGEGVQAVLLDTAARLLHQIDSRVDAADAINDTVCGLFAVRDANTYDPRAWLETQLNIAVGMSSPDATWALGQAWRLIYPAMVERQDRTCPCGPTLGWPEYGRWATQMERLAFGPPPVNAALLLELMGSGVVEVVRSCNPQDLARDRGAALLVDAVLPPPGARAVRDHLVEDGLHTGTLEVSRHGRGVLVDRDATSLVGGHRVPGFSVVGRLTEDVVIGNDTLIATLHPHLDRWARRILGLKSADTDG